MFDPKQLPILMPVYDHFNRYGQQEWSTVALDEEVTKYDSYYRINNAWNQNA